LVVLVPVPVDVEVTRTGIRLAELGAPIVTLDVKQRLSQLVALEMIEVEEENLVLWRLGWVGAGEKTSSSFSMSLSRPSSSSTRFSIMH
jgi:hypothetical protein